jgi:hypothetical protein
VQFDKDNSGFVDKKEMRACLYSLGEELQRSQVEQLVTQFGSGGRLSLPQFKQLMISLLGVSTTQDNILKGFEYIARGRDDVPANILSRYLSATDVAFVTKTAPSSAEGLLYRPWVEEVFAR